MDMKDKYGNKLKIGDTAQIGDMIGKIVSRKRKLYLEVEKPIDCMDIGLVAIKESMIIKLKGKNYEFKLD